ncbi:MAG: flavodoxin reductase [Saprospiraceae bacterium]|uniref:Flavodoxin reductase n=1 Tax=Candidatus Opimibacter skivensis TaxID=2982028 RepID=A0A9D7SWW1_9BACT|nr:flavodoxin reductase [Candidatus Opimibacter skivensis]
MSEYPVKILSLHHVTHNVLQVVTEKPQGYAFHPGQATDVSINKPGWKDELRPFTFTCLPDEDHLEFTIKTYPERKGVTNELLHLSHGDELILHDVFGDIGYKDEGVFIAGGAGITPFIAIFRYLNSKNKIGANKLIFANKTKADIIHEEEFRKMLGKNFINILSDENVEGYEHGYITKEIIKTYISGPDSYLYLCGPPPLMDAVEKQLADLGVDEKMIIKEGF